MGSVIGKVGSKIKEIQDASGARLQASEVMLPGSTEVSLAQKFEEHVGYSSAIETANPFGVWCC
jgi:hypothetical protein